VAQRLGDDVGHRDRAPGREVGLALARVLATNERVAHADPLGLPVDITPAQAQQLRLTQSGQRRDQDDDPQHRSQDIGRRRRRPAPTAPRRRGLAQDHLVGDRTNDPMQLGDRQEQQVGIGVARAPSLGTGGAAHRVLGRPTLVDRVLEDRVQEGDDVANGLGRLACASISSARSSTWVCVTRSTGFEPNRGEMCTRCLDSHPCKYEVRQPSIFSLRRNESVASSTVRRSETERVGVRSSSSCILRNRRSASARVNPSDVPLTRALPTLRFSLRPSAIRHRP
jgi:hypothetical protein